MRVLIKHCIHPYQFLAQVYREFRWYCVAIWNARYRVSSVATAVVLLRDALEIESHRLRHGMPPKSQPQMLDGARVRLGGCPETER